MTLRTLHALYAENDGGHYFDPATLEWFGSTEARARRLPTGHWLYSEFQSEAPLMEVAWRSSIFTPEGRGPVAGASAGTREESDRLALAELATQ